MSRWITPAQLDRLLRLIGTPEQAEEMLRLLKDRELRWRWNREFWANVKTVLLWLGYGGGALGFVIAVRVLWLAFAGELRQ
jgi:hypothetical protein